eukprot:CAMPEP_0197825466 /NCGR_PEP_ID=MMETSP1437-20131217/2536_1 /TAXON_ID=49252 ORGANISM="Eucampia antarctica, Strain CCMP1452" /NCGR_SAMPLE_ID=MMETSP1437 /ASSEMBLY_ACC=CAM_ASM_001096 /LENGTH=739 /DNA_ID=CAMNT_0043425469 /DNA_START=23 /DNA_END=2242 /DNA_ORIENTATION=+
MMMSAVKEESEPVAQTEETENDDGDNNNNKDDDDGLTMSSIGQKRSREGNVETLSSEQRSVDDAESAISPPVKIENDNIPDSNNNEPPAKKQIMSSGINNIDDTYENDNAVAAESTESNNNNTGEEAGSDKTVEEQNVDDQTVKAESESNLNLGGNNYSEKYTFTDSNPSNDMNNQKSNALPPGVPTGVPSEVAPIAQAGTQNLEEVVGMVEEKDTVPTMYVGRVIGKGGEMIRDLQARSGCRIDVDQNVPAGAPRIITYRGCRKTVDFAKQLVSMLCQSSDRGSSEDHLPLGEATRKHLVVPTTVIGKIIGRGGEMIRELQSKSGAKIQVDHSGAGGVDPSMRQVTVTGTNPSVVKADEMIRFLIANPAMDAMAAIAMLIKDKTHSGGKWGSGPPYPNMPTDGSNMVGRDGYGHGHNVTNTTNAGNGNHQSHNHNQQSSGYGGYAAAQQQQHHHNSAPPQYQQQHQTQALESEIFPCAKMYMGRVIGQKGVTINDLQKRSGCDIQINQDVAPGHDCEITIKGPREGIDTAKNMLSDIIQLGPHHPYAGGNNNNGSSRNRNQNNQQWGAQQQQQQQPPPAFSGDYPPQQQQHQQYAPQQQSYPPQGYSNNNNNASNTNNNTYGGAMFAQQPQQSQPQPQPSFGAHPSYNSNYAAQPQQVYPAQPQTQPPQQQQQQQQQQPPPSYYQQQQQPPPPYVQPTPQPAPVNYPVWKTAQAPDGQTYYYNEKTAETSWDKPPGMP